MSGFAGEAAQAIGDGRRPAGVMARAEAAPRITVEIFVKEKIVLPERIDGVAAEGSRVGPRAVRAGQENRGRAALEFPRHRAEVHHLAAPGRAFNLETAAVEMVITLERLDQQIVDRKPDRP